MARKALQTDQIVKLIVGAGQASPSPPVGPALGSKGVKSMDFCKVLPIHHNHFILHNLTFYRNSTPAQQTTYPAHPSQPASRSAPTAVSPSNCAHHPPAPSCYPPLVSRLSKENSKALATRPVRAQRVLKGRGRHRIRAGSQGMRA